MDVGTERSKMMDLCFRHDWHQVLRDEECFFFALERHSLSLGRGLQHLIVIELIQHHGILSSGRSLLFTTA